MKHIHTIAEYNQSELYEIRIKGHLNVRWADRFDGFAIILEEGGTTLLSGPVTDQSALYGLLRKVRDCGLPLISVMCVDDSQNQ